MAKSVSVLIIDDQPSSVLARLNLLPATSRRGVTVTSPDDVTREQIEQAALILVDYKLDEWRVNASENRLCRHVPNGIALAAILQQYARKMPRPRAFAIHSDHLNELTEPHPPEPRVHLVARTYNLEWAFVKAPDEGGPAETIRQAHVLAAAVAKLPANWPSDDSAKNRKHASTLLGLDSRKPWAYQAWREVELAHPPLDELTKPIHGLLFLRWLLTRVIAYPCFLMHQHWLAARLGATVDSVQGGLRAGLGQLFGQVRYKGILEGFQGERWWRIGVEKILWDLADKSSVSTSQLHSRIVEKYGVQLAPAEVPDPVVCLDHDYKPLSTLHSPAEAVRLQIDDWPAHAETAWTTITLAKDAHFRGLVIEADQPRLGEES
jgi:hypothetical protein